MAYFTPSAFEWNIVQETVAGSTPGSPQFMRFVHKAGDNFKGDHDWLEADVVRQGRGSAGGRKTNIRSTGTLSTIMQRGAANEALMLAAIGGSAWTSNVATGGVTDTSFTIEKKLSSGAYQRSRGTQVTGFTLDATYDGFVEASFDFLGMEYTNATAALTTPTYGAAPTTTLLTGREVTAVSLGGMTGLSYTSLNLSIAQDREAIGTFGSNSALGVVASTNRKITGSVTFHREDFTAESTLGDAGVAFSFTIGSGVNGLKFDLPIVFCKTPSDETDGAKAYVTVEFDADTHATNSDIKITRLT